MSASRKDAAVTAANRANRRVVRAIAEQRKTSGAEADLRRREGLEFTPRQPRTVRKTTREHRDATIEAAAATDFPRFRRVRSACCEHAGPSTDLDLHAAQIVLTLAGMAPA
ncbi:MAG: hypothetical protein NUW01_19120 [Gemmatimonadaceae bacterium]|nr:hypothetical protein [Gemmatimonadaceae bacterium]